jgi:molybdopterin-guanine dinucleotide biosynthesis protein A
MGRDKAALPAPPYRTLLERQLALLDAVGACERIVSARIGQSLPRDACGHRGGGGRNVKFVRDDGAAGPLGGLIAVLRAALAPRVIVLAVDAARMDAFLLRRVIGVAQEIAEDVGVVPRTAEAPQSLTALWPRSMLPLAEGQLAAGRDYSLRTLVASGVASGNLRWLEIPSWDERFFANWNRPLDWARS